MIKNLNHATAVTKILANKKHKYIGNFYNQFGELFIIYGQLNPFELYMVGDETDWESLVWQEGTRLYGNDGNEFILGYEETIQALIINMNFTRKSA
jgi:hypothetical protein